MGGSGNAIRGPGRIPFSADGGQGEESGVVAPQDAVAPEEAIAPEETVALRGGVAPHHAIAPQDAIAPQEAVAPEDGGAPDVAIRKLAGVAEQRARKMG